MKNTILFLLLCCVFAPCMLFAQTEFSQTGTQWKTNYSSVGSWTYDDVWIDYLYELKEDTLLCGKYCKKMYQDGRLIGAFLEEEHKLWYYPFYGEDLTLERVLLYDFSLEKGDKLESYKVPWNTSGDLSNLYFSEETMTLSVENVYYEYGRKVIEISGGNVHDTWIEGIGSPDGFWGAFLLRPTDGSSTNTSLVQTLASDKGVIFFKGEIIDPNYKSTFLNEGKIWEVLNCIDNTVDKITIGKPIMIDNYLRYPVYSSIQPGYLYDVNGTIYFMFDRGDGIGMGLDCDHLLYNFKLVVGNSVYLCTNPYDWGYGSYIPPQFEWYNVTQVDEVQCRGKLLKRIVLEGDIKHVWVENIGSLNSFLYLTWNGNHLDIPQHKLLRCYIGDEVIYDSADFPDGIEESIASVPTYIVADGQLTIKEGVGYSLSLYDISGIEIYARNLTETTEIIPLSDLSPTLMVGKLQKEEFVITFKIKGSDE